MKPIVCALLVFVSTLFRSRRSLQLEIVALRHQLAVYQRTTKRPQISSGDPHIIVAIEPALVSNNCAQKWQRSGYPSK